MARALEAANPPQADAGGWPITAVVGELREVADCICRIADQIDNTHYCAEKASPLLRGALNVRLEAHARRTGPPSLERLQQLAKATEDVKMAVSDAMWAIAAGRPIEQSTAHALQSALGELNVWVAQASREAVPDEN